MTSPFQSCLPQHCWLKGSALSIELICFIIKTIWLFMKLSFHSRLLKAVKWQSFFLDQMSNVQVFSLLHKICCAPPAITSRLLIVAKPWSPVVDIFLLLHYLFMAALNYILIMLTKSNFQYFYVLLQIPNKTFIIKELNIFNILSCCYLLLYCVSYNKHWFYFFIK